MTLADTPRGIKSKCFRQVIQLTREKVYNIQVLFYLMFPLTRALLIFVYIKSIFRKILVVARGIFFSSVIATFIDKETYMSEH